MVTTLPKIYLKPKKDTPVRRFHPWVFSGAIAKQEGELEDGTVVEVYSHRGDFLATGHYHNGSIAVKIIAFEPIMPNANFWFQKLKQAFQLRADLGFMASPNQAYRLVHGEGDGLPGLIIDVYGDVVVVQAHTIGMHLAIPQISTALQELYSDRIQAIYNKSKQTLPKDYARTVEDGYLWGEAPESGRSILEHGNQFQINWQTGQKTGFFLDQRENRNLLSQFSKGKRVLNAFCYSGGFSIYALKAGASLVHSVDASAKAIDLVEENVRLNGFEGAAHESFQADVMQFLKGQTDQTEQYDVMVLDPPAYAKTVSKRHRAVQAYKRLNMEGMKRLVKGGILFTFSCSQVVDNALFYNTITAAAIEARRTVRVLHRLSQPADHPVNMFHPEGNYLKGLVLHVS